MRALAILQNAWNPRLNGVRQPYSFVINPNNHTGKKLYYILEGVDFEVTNANPIVTSTAKGKGKTDLEFLANALEFCNYDFLLVCGAQAEQAYLDLTNKPKVPTLLMMHPASRNFTNMYKEEIRKESQRIARGNKLLPIKTKVQQIKNQDSKGWGIKTTKRVIK